MARLPPALMLSVGFALSVLSTPSAQDYSLKDSLNIGWTARLPITREVFNRGDPWSRAGYVEGLAAGFRYVLSQPGADPNDLACLDEFGDELFSFGTQFGGYVDIPYNLTAPGLASIPATTPVAEMFSPYLRQFCHEMRKIKEEEREVADPERK